MMPTFPSKRKYPPTVVLRHRKENLKKCTLVVLEQLEDFIFYRYPLTSFPQLNNYVLLKVDAIPLSEEDRNAGLLILDGTWRYASKMLQYVKTQQTFAYRSIPNSWKTAYPRTQIDCPDPQRGLASIEAIFAAYHILGRDTTGLLDSYYWKNLFFKRNGL
jgi:pre-rRNA-processing protein TSR3